MPCPPKKHPWHLGNSPTSRGLSGAIISWRLLPTKSFFNGKGDPSAAGNDWIYWSRRGALGSLGRKWAIQKKDDTNIGGWLKWMCFFFGGGVVGERERNVKHFDLQWNGEFLLEGNWQRPFCTQFQDGEMLSCQIAYFAPTNISKTKTHQG